MLVEGVTSINVFEGSSQAYVDRNAVTNEGAASPNANYVIDNPLILHYETPLHFIGDCLHARRVYILEKELLKSWG